MILQFDRVNKLVIVPDPEVEVSVQEIYDQSQDRLDRSDYMDVDTFVYAEGKTDLGGTKGLIVVTLFMLQGWRVAFEGRAGPTWTVCEISGGNIVGRTGVDKDTTPQHPVAGTSFVHVLIANASTGLILTDASMAADISQLQTDVETLTIWARAKKVTSQVFSKLFVTDATSGRSWEADLYADESETTPYAGEGIEVQDELTET